MKRLVCFLGVSLLLVLGFGWLAPAPTQAQSSAPIQPLASAILSTSNNAPIDPVSIVNLQNGESDTLSLEFVNNRDFSAEGVPRLFIEDFEVVDELGSIQLVDAEVDYTWRAASWVHASGDFSNFGAEEYNFFDFVVSVPVEAEAGSYYAAIIFSDQNDEQLGQHLLVVNVGGADDILSDLSFAEGLEAIDLTQAQIQIGLENNDHWHVYPRVNLRVMHQDASLNAEWSLRQPHPLGLPPYSQQLYVLWEDQASELAELLATPDETRQAQIIVFCGVDQAEECLPALDLEIPNSAQSVDNSTTPEGEELAEETEGQEAEEGAAAEGASTSTAPPSSSDSGSLWQSLKDWGSGPFVTIILAIVLIGGGIIASLLFLKAWHKKRQALDFSSPREKPARKGLEFKDILRKLSELGQLLSRKLKKDHQLPAPPPPGESGSQKETTTEADTKPTNPVPDIPSVYPDKDQRPQP